MNTVKFGYASSKSISFKGELDTGIPLDEWEDYSDEDKAEVENEALWDLVDIWVIDGEGSADND